MIGREVDKAVNKAVGKVVDKATDDEMDTSSLEDVQESAEPVEVVFDCDERLDENMFLFLHLIQKIWQDQHIKW